MNPEASVCELYIQFYKQRHQINVRGHEMINGSEKKTQQSSDTQVCFQFLDFFSNNFEQSSTSNHLVELLTTGIWPTRYF